MSLVYELLYFCDCRYKQRKHRKQCKQGTDTNVVGGKLPLLNQDQVPSEELDPPQGCSQDQRPTDENANDGIMQGLKRKIQEQQEEIQKLENTNQDLQQTVENRNQRIQGLEQSSQEKQKQIRNLENNNQELLKTNRNLKQNVERLEQTARDMQQNLEQQKEDLEKRLKNMQEQKNAVTEDRDTELKLARAETKLEDNDKYQSEIGDLNEILKSKEIELKGATTELEYTQKEMNEYKTKCAKLEEDCERYRSKSEESDKKLGEARIFIQVMTDNQATLLSGKGDGKDDQGLGEHLHLLV